MKMMQTETTKIIAAEQWKHEQRRAELLILRHVHRFRRSALISDIPLIEKKGMTLTCDRQVSLQYREFEEDATRVCLSSCHCLLSGKWEVQGNVGNASIFNGFAVANDQDGQVLIRGLSRLRG